MKSQTWFLLFKKSMLRYPLDKIKITQNFGERPQVYAPLLGHNGLDFRTEWDDSPTGNRPVYAADNGIVELGDQGSQGYGKFVRLHHADGSQTIYGHLSEQCVVDKQSVFHGKKIGISGNTGFTNAPHLHFGYRPPHFNSNNGYGGYVDPRTYMTTEISVPYLEQKIGQAGIALYDPEHDLMVGFADGGIFKMFYGDYSNIKINQVAEWSRPLSQELIFKA